MVDILADALEELGFRLVMHVCDGEICFVCAMRQRYYIRLEGMLVHGLDPYHGHMQTWDLNHPDSLDQLLQWCQSIRHNWRMARKLIDGLGTTYDA